MKNIFGFIIGIIALFSVILQLYLMIENRVADVPETIIRFFSFFTILTNLLVGIYFSILINSNNFKASFFYKLFSVTSVTIYIFIVGLVYQIALRHIWQPTGLQRLVDELLHSIIPVLVVLYWYFYENKNNLKYSDVWFWLIYPIVYLIFILIRGQISGYYPYPFVNIPVIGTSGAAINIVILIVTFGIISLIFVKIAQIIAKPNKII